MKSIKIIDIHLEFLKHFDNWVFIIPIVSGVVYLCFTGLQWMDVFWFLLGWIIFLPQEYLTHRYILHAKSPRSERVYRWMYRLHYGHHDQPTRLDLMYIPLWLTLPMLAANILILTSFFPDSRAVISTLMGLFLGYLVYEWTHLSYHMPYIPRTKFGIRMRQRHAMHHYLCERYWYAVSIPALPLDNLFGTMKLRDEVKRSETRFSLGLPQDHPVLQRTRELFAKHSDDQNSNPSLKKSCKKESAEV